MGWTLLREFFFALLSFYCDVVLIYDVDSPLLLLRMLLLLHPQLLLPLRLRLLLPLRYRLLKRPLMLLRLTCCRH